MAEQKKTNEALNVEDALTQSEAFFIKNKKAIIGAVVAVIIIIAGVVMYKNLYADPREEKAQAALFKGQEYFEADAYAQALNGDSIGFAGFVKVADEYSGTKAANLAKAYMGLCYAHLGKYDEAVKALDSFDGDDQMVSPAESSSPVPQNSPHIPSVSVCTAVRSVHTVLSPAVPAPFSL